MLPCSCAPCQWSQHLQSSHTYPLQPNSHVSPPPPAPSAAAPPSSTPGAAVLAGAPRELLGPRTGGGSSSSSRHLVLSQQKERLDGAVSYLELPQNIATAARQLLPLVVSAYGKAEPRMHMSPATVAAVIYIAARQEGRALSLGMAAAAVTAAGPDVFKEFRCTAAAATAVAAACVDTLMSSYTTVMRWLCVCVCASEWAT